MGMSWFPSKWGEDDEIGALNEISPSKIVEAARLVKKGKVYNLGHILEDGIPVNWFHGQFHYATFRRHGETLMEFGRNSNCGGMNMRMEMADHTGTHIDGLNHVSIGNRLYNGLLADEITGTFGTSKLGMEKSPMILTRGILIDIATLKGVNRLDSGYQITEDDVRSAIRQNGLEIAKGDSVLVATGWSQLWMSDNQRYSQSCPGIGLDVARWLAEKGISVIGSDNWDVEIDQPEDPLAADAVHKFCIVEKGIRLIENMDLEELRHDRVMEFLFVCLPLRLKGGTGSPITPIAVI